MQDELLQFERNKTLEGVAESLNKVVSHTSSNKDTIQLVQQTVQSLSQGLSSKAENTEVQDLQQIVGKVTTVITDITNQIRSICAKTDSQDNVLQEILSHRKNTPTPSPSFTETDTRDMKMFVEFQVLDTIAFAELEDKFKK
ncbi:hypothetical protein L6452_38861 [Arctium lappa]|uniref:Uncharacterized protein n=1 Tax=Arctium lappa TaxID=4217 RepID=A0ACB8XR67_ARCLA|nr:hypothetical protein L6452_38861 [Arctium lappa]